MKLAPRSQAPAFAALLFAFGSLGCSDDDTTSRAVTEADVVNNYAVMVSANYADSLKAAEALHDAVHELIESPSEKSLEDAKQVWLASRDPYGESEAYRFYQGPIDNDDTTDDVPEGPEGLINSWPLDESYIDYVLDGNGEPLNGGIVNLVDEFPDIDAETIAAANTEDGESETSISTGYHAIEFLLWGQDSTPPEDRLPGQRPFTDYVAGEEGTAENQERRATYVLTAADLLVDNLSEVNSAWVDGKANYRADFVAMDPKLALGKILLGMGSLAGGELAHERMRVAYDNRDQEDEHSCFSDNTIADLRNNATSVQNVLLGRYGSVKGASINDLLEAKDPALAKQLRDEIQDALDNILALEQAELPLDFVIQQPDEDEGRVHMLAAITALEHFADTLSEAAKAIDVDVTFDL
jgi:putative iron-regulated protein